MTEETPAGAAAVTRATLDGDIVVEVAMSEEGEADLHLHRVLLDGLLPEEDAWLGEVSELSQAYLRFRGRKIAPENDRVVASFHRASVKGAGTVAHRRAARSRYSGYKAYLGARTEIGDDGQRAEVGVYFRLILDWSYQSQAHRTLSLHRAAFVISQVPAGAVEEEWFYRFPPGRRPLRSLACVLVGAELI